jgi:hypothetical protein
MPETGLESESSSPRESGTTLRSVSSMRTNTLDSYEVDDSAPTSEVACHSLLSRLVTAKRGWFGRYWLSRVIRPGLLFGSLTQLSPDGCNHDEHPPQVRADKMV